MNYQNEPSELENNSRFLAFVRRYSHMKAEGFFDDAEPALLFEEIDERISHLTGVPPLVVCEARITFEDGIKAFSALLAK